MREELLLVLGTSSSEPGLPGLMEKMERVGCARPVVGIVVPSGYSFNLDGTCIYLTMAALFIAQATDTPMSLGAQLWLLAILTLTSNGAAGVTGSGVQVRRHDMTTFRAAKPGPIATVGGAEKK